MKNYRWHLRDRDGKTIATAFSLNTARGWLRVKLIDQTVWDGHAEREIESISSDLKQITCKEIK